MKAKLIDAEISDTEMLDWVSNNWETQEFHETIGNRSTNPKQFRELVKALMMGADGVLKKYYVHFNGSAWFVKEAEFFKKQGGHRLPWGRGWMPIMAESIEDARIRAPQEYPNGTAA